jgi:co-chaperonin GroES (HSP10)
MIKPLGNILLIKKIESSEKTTKTGLVISAAFSDQGPSQGTVIAVGNGEANYKGDVIPINDIDVGDIVFFPAHAGTDIEDEDGTKYVLVNCKNILAIKEQ